MPAAQLQDGHVIALIILLGLMIGFAKGGFNALGALLTPILSLVLPVASAVGVLLPMLIVGDVFAVYAYWKEWDSDLIKRMLPTGILGAWLGTFLLSFVSADGLRIVLGLFVLASVAYKLLSDRIQSMRYQHRPWHAPAAGLLSGVASGMFNSGGPPFSSFLLLQKLQARRFIATTAIFFALLNIIKVPGFLYTGILNLPLLSSLWWVFPFIPFGIWVARMSITRLSPAAFEWIVIVPLIFSSLWLLR